MERACLGDIYSVLIWRRLVVGGEKDSWEGIPDRCSVWYNYIGVEAFMRKAIMATRIPNACLTSHYWDDTSMTRVYQHKYFWNSTDLCGDIFIFDMRNKLKQTL